MAVMRWESEMEESMELLYHIQSAHYGRVTESTASEELGPWVADAARRAQSLSWLAIKGLQRSSWSQSGDEGRSNRPSRARTLFLSPTGWVARLSE